MASNPQLNLQILQKQFKLDAIRQDREALAAQAEVEREGELQEREGLIGRRDASVADTLKAAGRRGVTLGLSGVADGWSEAVQNEFFRGVDELNDVTSGRQSVSEAISDFDIGGAFGRMKKSFTRGRDKEQAEVDASRESNPKLHGAVETLTSIPATIATGGMGKATPYVLGATTAAVNSEHNLLGEDANPLGVLKDAAFGAALGKVGSTKYGAPAMMGLGLATGDEADRSAIVTGMLTGGASRLGTKLLGKRAVKAGQTSDEALHDAQRGPKRQAEKAERGLQGVDDERTALRDQKTRELREELDAELQSADDDYQKVKFGVQKELRRKRLGQSADEVIQQKQDVIDDADLSEQLKGQNAQAKEARRRALQAFRDAVRAADDDAALDLDAKDLHQKDLKTSAKRAEKAAGEAEQVKRSAEGEERQAYQTVKDRYSTLKSDAPEKIADLSPEARDSGDFVDASYHENADQVMRQRDPRKIRERNREKIETAQEKAQRIAEEDAKLREAGYDPAAYRKRVQDAREAAAKRRAPVSRDPQKVGELAREHGVRLDGEYDPKRNYDVENAPETVSVREEVARRAAQRDIDRVRTNGPKQPVLKDGEVQQRRANFMVNDLGHDADIGPNGTGRPLKDPWLAEQFELRRQKLRVLQEARARAGNEGVIETEVRARTAKGNASLDTRADKLRKDVAFHNEAASPEYIKRQGEIKLENTPVGGIDNLKHLVQLKTNPVAAIFGMAGGNRSVLNNPDARHVYYNRVKERALSNQKLAKRYGDLFAVGPSARSADKVLALLFKGASKDEELAAEMAEVAKEIEQLKRQQGAQE